MGSQWGIGYYKGRKVTVRMKVWDNQNLKQFFALNDASLAYFQVWFLFPVTSEYRPTSFKISSN